MSADGAAEALDTAVQDGLLNVASAQYAKSIAELDSRIETANQLLASSEGNVSDNVAREALQTRIVEARILLDERPDVAVSISTDGAQSGSSDREKSGSSDAQWSVERYEGKIGAIAALVAQIEADSAAVEAAVSAKSEADRAAAEAERIAAEEAAAASESQTTRKYNNGCTWEKDADGWLIGWKALGWCTEEDWEQYRWERDVLGQR